ncbi:hypothetical protein ACHAW5_000840 [Stephanodiscus triporus]|uniref:Uncharacterized protein n=1 Tax=Stephanodiscus triporus TaxID=2934178 RepID=A0ABD3P0M1_9STRA
MRATLAIVASVALIECVSAHFSFVDIRSQIACDFYADDGPNWLSLPILAGANFSQWWMHGQVNCQNKAKGSFALPANGATQIVMSSRVEYVPYPFSMPRSIFEPPYNFRPQNPDYVLTQTEWGSGPDSRGNTLDTYHNIHAYKRSDTSGCALAIAYKNKAIDVRPEDFVIFSVIHDCPKRQRESIKVPNLPACPNNNNCICAWFWIPKNSGTKNFYMTPFVCHVTNAKAGASPVDVEYAIPPRRCLDPTNCNFGPRQPAYWLGTGDHINMPENTLQSPHYSIRYGFREGAQHDIFVNTNPRRHVAVQVPVAQNCSSSKTSRIVQPHGLISRNLTSPNCQCTAMRMSNGELRIYDNTTHVSTVNNYGGNSGPHFLVNNTSFKANTQYFPLGVGPYRMDLSNKCYLYVTDGMGVVVWESMFNKNYTDRYVINIFTGLSQDPARWPTDNIIYTRPPTSQPTSSKPTASKPSLMPTSKPTSSPKPTTLNPSLRPTTSKPSTSRPTVVPTQSLTAKPTTEAPTGKPTMALPMSSPTSYSTLEPTTMTPTMKQLSTTTSSTPNPTSEPTTSNHPNALPIDVFQ